FEEVKKGADYAGVSLEDFARLSEKTQEQYIEYANRIVEANKGIVASTKEITEAAGEGGKGLTEGVGKGLDEVTEKSGISSKEMRAFGKILSAFGLGEIGHVLTGLARVAYTLGPVGGIALAAGLASAALAKFGKAALDANETAEKLSKVTANSADQLSVL